MTLTTILPTLRDSIPAPFDSAAWPAGARAGIGDVTVSAISLRRYAELCGTPCVCTGAAVIPLSGGVASRTDSTTVLLLGIAAVDDRAVVVDGRISHLQPVWREARLLGRVSHAHEKPFAVRGADGSPAAVVLPGDVRVGDLVAVPCPGLHTVGELRVGVAKG
ncbi:hypothetical protein [Microbacterium lushaniae]|uniref:hypothetical protein n=1 Tax=Microbacterium lushaniae TaxID=2614639 RepID=UPI00177E1D3A|nr:hypothetical protein [Microbacterium lushaniae]